MRRTGKNTGEVMSFWKVAVCLATAGVLPGAVIYSNGGPNLVNGRDIVAFRSADDFVLGSGATLGGIRYWSSVQPGRPFATDFSGQLTWGVYANNGGALGTLLHTGTVSGLTGTATGQVFPGSNSPVYVLEFTLGAPVALNAGTYWLELHEGASLTANDGSSVLWLTAAASGNAKQAGAGGLPESGINQEYAFELLDAPGAGAGVPEPGTVWLLGGGLLASFAGWRRRESRRRSY